MGASHDTKYEILSTITEFFNLSSKRPLPQDAHDCLIEASYVIQSLPSTLEQTTLGDLFFGKGNLNQKIEWAIDEPQEIFIHDNLAAVWTGWSIRADDGSLINRRKGLLGLAHTQGRWKISGLASTERSLETPDPKDEGHPEHEIMQPINALLHDFSHPDWDTLKVWFIPGAGVTLYRPPAEPAPMTMEQSIVRLQNMIKSGITIQEKLHDVQVRKHGGLALVWAPFVVEINRQPAHNGVNAFTLLKGVDKWCFAGCQDYGVPLSGQER
ncbi:hypothetical protein ACLX1H_010826 [Fusarium chlamydosporum]